MFLFAYRRQYYRYANQVPPVNTMNIEKMMIMMMMIIIIIIITISLKTFRP